MEKLSKRGKGLEEIHFQRKCTNGQDTDGKALNEEMPIKSTVKHHLAPIRTATMGRQHLVAEVVCLLGLLLVTSRSMQAVGRYGTQDICLRLPTTHQFYFYKWVRKIFAHQCSQQCHLCHPKMHTWCPSMPLMGHRSARTACANSTVLFSLQREGMLLDVPIWMNES